MPVFNLTNTRWFYNVLWTTVEWFLVKFTYANIMQYVTGNIAKLEQHFAADIKMCVNVSQGISL